MNNIHEKHHLFSCFLSSEKTGVTFFRFETFIMKNVVLHFSHMMKELPCFYINPNSSEFIR